MDCTLAARFGSNSAPGPTQFSSPPSPIDQLTVSGVATAVAVIPPTVALA